VRKKERESRREIDRRKGHRGVGEKRKEKQERSAPAGRDKSSPDGEKAGRRGYRSEKDT